MADTLTAPPLAPMEARLVEALPHDSGWQHEPKWDGFRCLAAREHGRVTLWSKAGKPLGRYFPEIVALVEGLGGGDLLLDGELIVPIGDVLAFDALQARLHPAASRIARLSAETPAQLMLFDLLRLGGERWAERPLAERRTALERFHAAEGRAALPLSPVAHDAALAEAWLAASGGALDGVVAKRLDEPYRAGERAMLKVKQHRTADCVVGGFRHDSAGRHVASLLLGLYDEAGRLDHVGFTSAIPAVERAAVTARLLPLAGGSGFTGKAPGGPSRWTTARSAEWTPLAPELVVEVRYDQVTGNRFRHGTGFVRWRPDKAPEQCRMDQLARELRPAEVATITRAA